MRQPVKRFAQRMETVLQRHDPLKGNGWHYMSTFQILSRLDEEIKEVSLILQNYRPEDKERLLDELADVANFAAFLNEE